MNKKPYRDILDSAARDALSRNTDLWPDIAARLERKSPLTAWRRRPVFAIVMALLFMLVLSGVAYALGQAFGYIPGVGIVDQSVPVRVLAEPVSVSRQGISITISRLVADSTRTFISYRVDGIPLAENGLPVSTGILEIHLPDGATLEQTCCSAGTAILKNGDTMVYEDEFISAPIPNGINAVTLVLSGGSLDTWEIPLDLIPAPAGFATPAVMIAVTPDGSENKTGLQLEKVLELADSYILIGKFSDGGDLPGPLSMSTGSDSEYLPRIEDANGKPVSFKVREDARPDPDWDVAYFWAYEISKPAASPLNITIDQVNIRKHHTAHIQLEAGDHPPAGKQWNINQAVRLGPSEFVVDSITFTGNGYTFLLTAIDLPEGVSPDIEIVDGSSSPFQFDDISTTMDKTTIVVTMTTQNQPPAGNLTVNWGMDEYIPQPGPWSLSVNLPDLKP